jgi:hypothetical protein
MPNICFLNTFCRVFDSCDVCNTSPYIYDSSDDIAANCYTQTTTDDALPVFYDVLIDDKSIGNDIFIPTPANIMAGTRSCDRNCIRYCAPNKQLMK